MNGFSLSRANQWLAKTKRTVERRFVQIDQAPRPHGDAADCKRTKHPRLAIITDTFGATSEVWVERQISAFRKLDPWVLTRERKQESGFGNSHPEVITASFSTHPGIGRSRWLRRAMRLPSRNFYAPDIREQQELSRILREKRTDIVLCHFGPVALSMLPVARSLNIPIVAHFHGYDLSSMLSDRWYRWALAANVGRFAALLVVGSHQKQWLLVHGAPACRVHLIPCGAPVEEFQKLEKKTANGRLRFIAVGRLVPCKGVKYTVEAFATLRQEGIDAELIIIGEGPERERLFRMAEALNVHGRVTFRGALPNSLVRDELSQADIFVQHSVESEDGAREGFGVSIAEASASALPVIATRCGGILDQIVDGATGLLVAQRDVRGMADAMIRLAHDPDLRMSLGLAGRVRAMEEFNAARQIEKLENVLVAAVAARP